jgi:hypothetical protein
MKVQRTCHLHHTISAVQSFRSAARAFITGRL